MVSTNKVFIMGHLGTDPSISVSSEGEAVTCFSVATNFVYVDKQGIRQNKADWHRVRVRGKVAGYCIKWLKKGHAVHVEGHMHTRLYKNAYHYTVKTQEIISEKINFLSKKIQADEYELEKLEKECPFDMSVED